MSKFLILILIGISTATDCKVNLLLQRSREIFTEYGTGLGEIKKKLKTEMDRMKMEKPNILMLELKAKTIWKHNRDLMRSPEEKLSNFNKSEEMSEIDEQFEDEDSVNYDFQNDNVLFSYNMEIQKAKKLATARLVLHAHHWYGQEKENRRAKNRIKLRTKKMLDTGLFQDEALLALEQIITKFHSNVGLVNYIGNAIGFNLERSFLLVVCFDNEATPEYFQKILSEHVGKEDVIEAIDLMEKLIALKNIDFKQEKLEILKKILKCLETEEV